MKFLIAATLGATVAISSPTLAQDTARAGSSANAQSSEEDDGSKMVCKRKAVTGTRIKKRLCYTQDQWDRIEQQSKEMANDFKGLGGIDSTRRGG